VRQGPRPGADRDERGAGARQRHVQQRHLRRALADQLQPGRQHAVALRPGAASQLMSTSHHARFSQHRRESRLCRFWLQLTVLVQTPTEAAQRHGQPLCSLTARPTSPRQGRAGAAVQVGAPPRGKAAGAHHQRRAGPCKSPLRQRPSGAAAAPRSAGTRLRSFRSTIHGGGVKAGSFALRCSAERAPVRPRQSAGSCGRAGRASSSAPAHTAELMRRAATHAAVHRSSSKERTP